MYRAVATDLSPPLCWCGFNLGKGCGYYFPIIDSEWPDQPLQALRRPILDEDVEPVVGEVFLVAAAVEDDVAGEAQSREVIGEAGADPVRQLLQPR